MRQLMCTACGTFVPAVPEGDDLVPVGDDSCPECGEAEFRQVGE